MGALDGVCGHTPSETSKCFNYAACDALAFFLNSVATAISHFVSFEVGAIDTFVLFGSLASVWHRPGVAMRRVKRIIHVTTEVGAAMKPGARPDEDAAAKPFRTVISGGGAAIWRLIVITVGALRSDSDVEADLGLRLRYCRREAAAGNGS